MFSGEKHNSYLRKILRSLTKPLPVGKFHTTKYDRLCGTQNVLESKHTPTPNEDDEDDEDFYFDEWLLLFLQKLKLKPCEADMVISVKPFLPHADTCLSDS